MSKIPDFNDTEIWTVRVAVNERYSAKVELEFADAELRLDPDSAGLTSRPTIFWSQRGANFVVSRVAQDRYRCQFFYSIREQYGTRRELYGDPAECVTALLQAQADHERSRTMTSDGNTKN